MVRLRTIRWAVASVLLATAGCGATATATVGSSATPAGSPHPAPAALVLRVASVGGFVTPATNYSRIPTLSVYDDGRVITEGPIPAIYPGPALPNLLVRRISARSVDRLAARARAAGVGRPTDFGTPGIADATSTRFTVTGADGTQTTEVYALSETSDQDAGLTSRQRAARARMRALLSALTDLPDTLGAQAAGTERPYRATAIVAVAQPWTASDTDRTSPTRAWPGAALPGRALGSTSLRCSTTTGAAATRVLTVAADAHSDTPWSYRGTRWSLTLRPLLPDESSCAALNQ